MSRPAAGNDSASEPAAVIEYRFLLAGAPVDDDSRERLKEAIAEPVADLAFLALLPVNQGLQLDLEVHSTAPFSIADYEDYLIDHVIAPALSQVAEAVRVKPLKSRRIHRD